MRAGIDEARWDESRWDVVEHLAAARHLDVKTSAMGSRQFVLSDTGTQQCGSRDIEHRLVGSV